MKPTNQMIHYSGGSNSVIGLQVMQDDEGQEFVQWGGQWVHVSEVPLPPHKPNGVHHREEIGKPSQEKKTPVFNPTPVVANLPAFQPTTPEQRDGSTLHPKALKYK